MYFWKDCLDMDHCIYLCFYDSITKQRHQFVRIAASTIFYDANYHNT